MKLAERQRVQQDVNLNAGYMHVLHVHVWTLQELISSRSTFDINEKTGREDGEQVADVDPVLHYRNLGVVPLKRLLARHRHHRVHVDERSLQKAER